MEHAIEITKIERTDTDVDNSRYEIKTPYEHTDDYGNTQPPFFKKETYLCVDYDAKITIEKERIEEELKIIVEISDKIDEIKENELDDILLNDETKI